MCDVKATDIIDKGEVDGECRDVIIVEDSPELGSLMEHVAIRGGLRPALYGTGDEALAALLARPLGRPALVLLDVQLPGVDGYTILDRIQAERPGQYGVVFVTGHGREADQIHGLRQGAIDYIVKPVSLAVLLAKIPIWLTLLDAIDSD